MVKVCHKACNLHISVTTLSEEQLSVVPSWDSHVSGDCNANHAMHAWQSCMILKSLSIPWIKLSNGESPLTEKIIQWRWLVYQDYSCDRGRCCCVGWCWLFPLFAVIECLITLRHMLHLHQSCHRIKFHWGTFIWQAIRAPMRNCLFLLFSCKHYLMTLELAQGQALY